jgi:NADH-quinone oxidoreductase subunit F
MEPILTKHVREPNSFTLDFYLQHQGYDALRKALGMAPNAVSDLVKASGLRGRGGAGFPTGMKWGFVDQKSDKPRYIACNADESEPGTFKDHLLMERNPHLLIEGCAIACYAIGAKVAISTSAASSTTCSRCSKARSRRPTRRGSSARTCWAPGSTATYVHRGAGALRSGEEIGLLESLEGSVAQPAQQAAIPGRRGPHNLADRGQQRRETLATCRPSSERRRVVRRLGPEKNGGPSCTASAATCGGRRDEASME